MGSKSGFGKKSEERGYLFGAPQAENGTIAMSFRLPHYLYRTFRDKRIRRYRRWLLYSEWVNAKNWDED
jgi:hypothetical protein